MTTIALLAPREITDNVFAPRHWERLARAGHGGRCALYAERRGNERGVARGGCHPLHLGDAGGRCGLFSTGAAAAGDLLRGGHGERLRHAGHVGARHRCQLRGVGQCHPGRRIHGRGDCPFQQTLLVHAARDAACQRARQLSAHTWGSSVPAWWDERSSACCKATREILLYDPFVSEEAAQQLGYAKSHWRN